MSRSINLTVSSPPQSFVEPLTRSEMKQYLQIEQTSPVDITDDDLIDSLISAAREVFEIEQGFDLVEKQYDLTLDCFDDYEIELRDMLVSVDLFRYRDSTGAYTTLAEDVDYIVDTAKRPGIVTPPYGVWWPTAALWPSSAVLIRFTAGLSATDAFWHQRGERIKTGMKILIKAWYIDEFPENESGIPWASQVLMRFGSVPRVR